MASLKDINASIEEGNENTEKLNANFSRWLKSQQTSGDDLEAAREKKRTAAVKGGDTFISNKITKGGGSSGILKNLLTKAALAATVAAAVAVALKLLKDKAKDLGNDDSIIEGVKNSTVVGTGALVAGSIYGGFKGRKYGNRMGTALNNAMEAGNAKKIAAQNQKIQNGTIRNNKIKILLNADEFADLKRQIKINEAAKRLRIKLLSLANAEALGTTGREVRTNTPKSRFSGFSNLNKTGGTVTGLNNMRNSSIRIPTAANTNIAAAANTNNKPRTARKNFNSVVKKALLRTTSLSSSLASKVKNIPSNIKSGLSVIPPNPGGFKGTNATYGRIVTAWLKGVSPKWAQKTFAVLMKPKVNIAVLGTYTLLNIGAILADYQINYAAQIGLAEDNDVPFLQKLTRARTRPEKAAAIAMELSTLTAVILGGAIGVALGSAIIPPYGSIAGAILGGLLGAMAMNLIFEFVFDLMDGKNMERWSKTWQAKGISKAYLDNLRGQGPSISNNKKQGGMIRRMAPAMSILDAFTNTSGSGVTDKALISGYAAMGASKTKAKKYGSFLNKDLFLGGADRLSKGNKTPDFVRGISGGGSSGAMSSGALTFPEVGNGLSSLSNQQGAGMIRRGSEAPVVVDASTKSFSDHKSVHMMPAVAPKTVDSMEYRTRAYIMIGSAASGMGLVN